MCFLQERQEMTDIVFQPLVSDDKDFVYCGVEARRKSNNARRSVFTFPSGRSSVYSLGSIFWTYTNNLQGALAKAQTEMQRITDILNSWIPPLSEKELNDLLRLRNEDPGKLTRKQLRLNAKYWLKYKA